MGVTKAKAAENRQVILATAERLFRERGVDGVGLAELMKEAGFTQGGFYNHFKSKEALAAEVVANAMAGGRQELADALAKPLGEESAVERQINYYLSEGHRDNVACGCSVGGLAGDVSRLGDDAQGPFAEGLLNSFALLDEAVNASTASSDLPTRDRTIGLYAEMIGGLVLARAVAEADPDLSSEILASTRRELLARFA